MNISIQLHDQPMFVTVEVDDELFNHYLTFKLQPEHSMITKKQPSAAFRSCVLLSHLSGAIKQFSVCRHRVFKPSPGASRRPLPEGEGGGRSHTDFSTAD
jgi:hypothetical protein